jgi:thiamine pyrophosphokinase
MIILNQPITRRDTLMRVWYASTLRYCADGGANRLYDALDPEERERMLPTMIKGDLDSIRPDVKAFYAARGVAIKRDQSEYATDLQKNMEEIEAVEKASGKNFSLVFLGGLSGRLDQTLHVMSTLFKLRETRRNTYVISEESLAWVLDTGVHLIEIDHTSMGQTCGLLPVGVSEAYVRTEGLKWNLDWVTSVMGSLSTSNHLVPHEHAVLVDTSAPIVWTVEIRKGLQIPALRSPTGVDELSRGVKELGRAVGKGMGSIGQGFNRRISRQGLPPMPANGDEGRRERNERAALVRQDSGYASRDDEADGYAQLD